MHHYINRPGRCEEEEEGDTFNMIDYTDNTTAQFWCTFLTDTRKITKEDFIKNYQPVLENFVKKYGLYHQLKFTEVGCYYDYLFHMAAKKGNLHVLLFLIDNDIDINLRNYENETALYSSIDFIKDECAFTLMDKGAKLSTDVLKKILSIKECSFLDEADRNTRSQAYFDKIKSLNIDIQPLLQDLDIHNNEHHIPVIMAPDQEHIEHIPLMNVNPLIFSSQNIAALAATLNSQNQNQDQDRDVYLTCKNKFYIR